MIKVFERLKKEKLDAALILQIHDELIIECKDSDTEIIEKLLKEEMENAVKLSVELIADVKSGRTWFDTK
jgi:DNA polymerase-1